MGILVLDRRRSSSVVEMPLVCKQTAQGLLWVAMLRTTAPTATADSEETLEVVV